MMELMSAAAVPMRAVAPSPVWRLKCAGSMPTAARPVMTPPAAPLMAAATTPLNQMRRLRLDIESGGLRVESFEGPGFKVAFGLRFARVERLAARGARAVAGPFDGAGYVFDDGWRELKKFAGWTFDGEAVFVITTIGIGAERGDIAAVGEF